MSKWAIVVSAVLFAATRFAAIDGGQTTQPANATGASSAAAGTNVQPAAERPLAGFAPLIGTWGREGLVGGCVEGRHAGRV